MIEKHFILRAQPSPYILAGPVIAHELARVVLFNNKQLKRLVRCCTQEKIAPNYLDRRKLKIHEVLSQRRSYWTHFVV